MKILLKTLFFVLSMTSGINAMQDVKREQEVKEKEDSKEVVELRELQRRFPHSVNFLIKVLGAQKDKQKTLLDRINPFAKPEFRVIKNGLPNDVILKIINNYLWIDKMKFRNNRNSLINPEDMVDAVTSYYRWDFHTPQDADYMSLTPNPSGLGKYYFSVGRFITDVHGRRGPSSCNAEFQFMDHSILDINPNVDTNLQAAISKNKYKIIAGLVSTSGITYYIVKKLIK